MKSSEHQEVMIEDKKTVSHHPGVADESADTGVTTVGERCLM